MAFNNGIVGVSESGITKGTILIASHNFNFIIFSLAFLLSLVISCILKFPMLIFVGNSLFEVYAGIWQLMRKLQQTLKLQAKGLPHESCHRVQNPTRGSAPKHPEGTLFVIS